MRNGQLKLLKIVNKHWKEVKVR